MWRFVRQSLDQQLKLLADGRVDLIAYASPYVAKLAEEPVDYLNQSGIKVVNRLGFEREMTSLEQNALTPEDAFGFANSAS